MPSADRLLTNEMRADECWKCERIGERMLVKMQICGDKKGEKTGTNTNTNTKGKRQGQGIEAYGSPTLAHRYASLIGLHLPHRYASTTSLTHASR